MNKEVYEFLKKEAEADKAKALASVKLLTKCMQEFESNN